MGLDDYMDMLGYSTGGGNIGTWMIVSVIIAVIGTVAAVFFLMGSGKRARMSGWMLKLYSHVNFENFAFAFVVKILYVFLLLFLVFYGLFTMFSGSFVIGLLLMVVGPLLVRIFFEMMMVFLSILDQVKETNRLLRGGAQQPHGEPQPGRWTSPQGGYTESPQQGGFTGQAPPQYGRPARRTRPETRGEEPKPEPPKRYPGGYDPMHRA